MQDFSKPIFYFVKKVYIAYFGVKLGDQDKTSKVKDFTRTSKRWKIGTREDGRPTCWQITAGTCKQTVKKSFGNSICEVSKAPNDPQENPTTYPCRWPVVQTVRLRSTRRIPLNASS
ncbi:hypothetical protein LAZ67_17001218 [Cordylochernes scorpioides]|uniref:Uncharacterized protein n=1 Tax=Cordylochernes scorpioides TaxID=51811 RepID=A0ABY6LGY2_9ARAC|nr:hypothetical protein LAZ67_17001218 [Cordylochernes scorpioides]